nr:hypothetical protein [Burkholderia vietnamiensis]
MNRATRRTAFISPLRANTMCWIKRTLVVACAGVAVVAQAEPAKPQLSIDDISDMARANIARQLSGNAPAPGAMTLPQPGLVASAPVAAKPAPVAAEKPARHARSEPVTFVGAYRDDSGASPGNYVLYTYHDAIYPGRVGTTLLNGWHVKGVEGYVVTVSDGRRTWTEPIHADVPAPSLSASAVGSLVNLGSPLPFGGPLPASPVALPPGGAR